MDLKQEALAMGLHYTGDDPRELHGMIEREIADHEGAPPCYLRSYDPRELLCRKCDLYQPCGAGVIAHVPKPPPEIVQCAREGCDGDLWVQLFDASGQVRDWGCSEPGCTNTYNQQVKK